MKRTTVIKTQVFDLDWNRHITSRTYEKFCYAARWNYLESLGYSIRICLEKGFKIIPKQTFVRFLAQQYEGSSLTIETQCYQDPSGLLVWHQMVFDADGRKSCELQSSSTLLDQENSPIFLQLDSDRVLAPLQLPELDWRERLPHKSFLEHSFYIPFSDMSCFWTLSSEAIWKVFEEGRFLFFKEVFDFSEIQRTDTSTFFMGGDISIESIPDPGSKVKLVSWIDSLEKIRFFFRQNLIDSQGKVLVRMRDEQLFVSLSKARPKKAPPEFLEKTKSFLHTE